MPKQTKKENLVQLGKEYDNEWKTSAGLKESLNLVRLLLGRTLNALEELHKKYHIKENYGTFNQCLATLQLTGKRANDMRWGAQYLEETGVPQTEWKYIDLSRLRLCRKLKIPITGEVIEDFKILTYNDFKKKYS